MPDANDMDLVREYARNQSEAVFTELVRHHVNLVYSIARRCTGSAAAASPLACGTHEPADCGRVFICFGSNKPTIGNW
jgi:hypothetical protein